MKTETIKILLLGDSYTGKSTLIGKLRNKDITEYSPTIFENIYHYLTLDNTQYQLHISDTSGSLEYYDLRKKMYFQVDIIILCFAVNNIDSFQHIESQWLPELHNSIKIPKLLVGLKIDTRYQQDIRDNTQILSYTDGKQLGEKLNLDYLENSINLPESNTREDSEKIFTQAIEIVNITRQKKNKNNKKNCIIM